MTDSAISAAGLSKLYRIGAPAASYSTLRDKLARAAGTPLPWIRRKLSRATVGDDTGMDTQDFWALDDVSFEIRRGEVVGVIGRNGAGKSTLLKILSRITDPTRGHAEIRGRVGSLLEVGTGFHLELSGRENLYLNGAILGMRRSEINARFDEIVDFAEVGKFIDTPVKHYSSGMYLRLAFSVAAHLEPEVLLIDEVLAVGDVVFQKRCLGKMGDVAAQGRTVLFVSHNLGAVKELCQTSLVLDKGRMVFRGAVNEGLALYSRTLTDVASEPYGRGSGWRETRVAGRSAIGPGPVSGDIPVEAESCLELAEDVMAGNVFCIIDDATGHTIIHQRTDIGDLGNAGLMAGRHSIHVQFPPLWLVPGMYTVYFKLVGRTRTGSDARWLSERVLLDVTGSAQGSGNAILSPRVRWTVAA